VATVRVLDFGGDKTPPFLQGTQERGVALLLQEPEAFAAQARAILAVAGDTDLRVMLPMVRDAQQLEAARAIIGEACVGAMIETADAVADVRAIAAAADFLSIGTNDLTHDILGSDRFTGRAAQTEDPRVLAAIHRVVEAGHAEGLIVEVCGEAASDPAVLPLLVGLGVDELSVGAARVGLTRAHVRELSFDEARKLATRSTR
jgi:phosphoenolpyruvate-protein kinase (PTS system EI component)